MAIPVIPSNLYACPLGMTSRFALPWNLGLWTVNNLVQSGSILEKSPDPSADPGIFTIGSLPIENLEIWARYDWRNGWAGSTSYIYAVCNLLSVNWGGGASYLGCGHNTWFSHRGMVGWQTGGTKYATTGGFPQTPIGAGPRNETTFHMKIGTHSGGHVYSSVLFELNTKSGVNGINYDCTAQPSNVYISGPAGSYSAQVGIYLGTPFSPRTETDIIVRNFVIFAQSGLENTCRGNIYAQFSVNPPQGQNETVFVFTDESGSIQGITSWLWDFGDGTISTLQNPIHSLGVGIHTVRLSVTGPDGVATTTRTIYVYGVVTDVQPRRGMAPHTVDCEALAVL
jgi:hypothetical protein